MKRLQTLQNLAPCCKSRAIYFLTVQHRNLFWGWLSFKAEIERMLHCGLSFTLTQLDAFQGWWASGLWATLGSSDSHTGVKGHLCWVRCYFQGDRHIYALAQPILFWISYSYSAAAISLSSENLFSFFFSFYFLPLRCKLFLIFVPCEWKLKKITLATEGKLKDLWILCSALGLLGRLAVFSTWQFHLADKQLKASMPTLHSRSKAWGLQCTALFFSCSEGWF